ncbi:MAG: hypothetical protein Q8L60_07405 [Gammaproteobacteria bacterium]|nr:hypothetical protein [Gammaproteobacteria bacterium]MDP2141869.1 hypothetical protein [Gammaproteobacteria bacterium]MDP2348180.1 hypothetical protein [Gammaproteobacteria bacterium]
MTEDRINNLKTSVGKFLAFSFVLVFLFAQSTSLVHTHAGDLKKHVDCELCLKVGSGDDVLATTHSIHEFSASAEHTAQQPTLATSFKAITAKSRSPPLFV